MLFFAVARGVWIRIRLEMRRRSHPSLVCNASTKKRRKIYRRSFCILPHGRAKKEDFDSQRSIRSQAPFQANRRRRCFGDLFWNQGLSNKISLYPKNVAISCLTFRLQIYGEKMYSKHVSTKSETVQLLVSQHINQNRWRLTTKFIKFCNIPGLDWS